MVGLIVSFGLAFAVMCIVCVGLVRHLPQPRRKAVVHLLGALLFFGGLLNFLIFWHVAVFLGGDAVSGKVEDGRYFVSGHGKLTEVSAETWRYSYAHTVSTWITHPLAGLGWLLMYLTDPDRKKPATDQQQPAPSQDSLTTA